MTEVTPLSTVARLLSLRSLRMSLYITIGALLTAWSWRKWPDLFIDFGRELYTPWRIAEGETLYRDIASFFGPLSQHLNGLVFRLFGVSFTTLIVTNLVLLAVLVWLIDDVFARMTDTATAALVTSAFLVVFPFSQYTNVANYNYLAPYAHEAVHGLFFSVAVLFLLGRSLTSTSQAWLAGAGLCFGLVHLTKPEPALALSVAVALHFLLRRQSEPHIGRRLGLFLGAALAVWVATFLFFFRELEARDSLKATLGAWWPVFSGAAGGDFYRKGLGFDDPLNNGLKALQGAAVFAATVVLLFLLDRLARLRPKWGVPLAVIVGIAIVVGLAQPALFKPWIQVGRPLPLIMAALLGLALWSLLRAPLEKEARHRRLQLTTWAAFSGAMLVKMALNARLYAYGFTLAMPATLMVLATLVFFIPSTMRQANGGGTVFRGLAICLTVAFCVTYWMWSERTYAMKSYDVGANSDRIVTVNAEDADRGPIFAATLKAVTDYLPPQATFTVLPEGVMLNYLSRHPTSTPYINYMPPELAAFSEAAIVASHEATPPDFVVLMHKNTREYGLGQFGASPEFGGHIMDWVRRNYEVVWAIGPEPFTGTKFGVRILQRRTRQAQP